MRIDKKTGRFFEDNNTKLFEGENPCRWCETAPKERGNHCAICYPEWQKEYELARQRLVYSEKNGIPMRYQTVFDVSMVMQGWKPDNKIKPLTEEDHISGSWEDVLKEGGEIDATDTAFDFLND